jgi:hypothetical protein
LSLEPCGNSAVTAESLLVMINAACLLAVGR